MDEKKNKKKFMKMNDAVFRYCMDDISFPEFVKTIIQVEEFYRE